VAQGVLGIALIQTILAALGMMVMGVPAWGVWTLIILVLAIAQLPPWLVLIPVSIYVFDQSSTVVASIYLVYNIVVSFLDGALKPLLIGRGMSTPMPVILIGAIGGMITSGIIGLFVGAIILALGYEFFIAWLNQGPTQKQDVMVDNVTSKSGGS
jgi:predicted PurR-regulated permease PerM